MSEIYGDSLDAAYKVTANHLESGVWMNRGENGFEWIALPRFAQIAPTFGIVSSDFDHDGKIDLHLVQNSYSTQPETGLWRGGVSQLLKGNGDGTFECIPASASGLIVADDGKASSLVDIDGDGRTELVVTQNNGSVRVFRSSAQELETLTMRAAPGTILTGSRITVSYTNRSQAFEFQAGAGYLSQAPAAISVGRTGLQSLRIRWPDGDIETLPLPAGGEPLLLKH